MVNCKNILAFVLIGIFSLVHLVFVGNIYIFGISSFCKAVRQLAAICLWRLGA